MARIAAGTVTNNRDVCETFDADRIDSPYLINRTMIFSSALNTLVGKGRYFARWKHSRYFSRLESVCDARIFQTSGTAVTAKGNRKNEIVVNTSEIQKLVEASAREITSLYICLN